MLAIFCHNAGIMGWLGSGEDEVLQRTRKRCPDFLSTISCHHKLSWKSSRGLLEKEVSRLQILKHNRLSDLKMLKHRLELRSLAWQASPCNLPPTSRH